MGDTYHPIHSPYSRETAPLKDPLSKQLLHGKPHFISSLHSTCCQQRGESQSAGEVAHPRGSEHHKNPLSLSRPSLKDCSMDQTIPMETAMAPTPVLLPGKSHGRRSLVGCSPWGRYESDTTERLHFHFTFMHWRRKWQPTPVFLPGESQGRGSLVGCRLWGPTELDTTEAT